METSDVGVFPGRGLLDLWRQMDPPFDGFDRTLLGADFAAELETASELWFACGYRPGIAAYLNFFLLRDLITIHEEAVPSRFATFRSMARSFYETDLFVRDVTDSGARPTGGISAASVRRELSEIMARHQALSIPGWAMTYFGFSLLETVEKEFPALDTERKRRHLAYLAKSFRIMGIHFSDRRDLMERFSRSLEAASCGETPYLERHARNILLLGEMVGVSSAHENISFMLSDAARPLFGKIYPRVRPGLARRLAARAAGHLLMKRAVGTPRKAVPAEE